MGSLGVGVLIIVVIAIVYLIYRNQGETPKGGTVAQPIGQGIVIREYKGKLTEATRLFQEDVPRMAASGYHPIAQQYQPGSWGCGAFLVAILLWVILIGVLIFLYMVIVKPAGSLVVTYQLQPAAPGAEQRGR